MTVVVSCGRDFVWLMGDGWLRSYAVTVLVVVMVDGEMVICGDMGLVMGSRLW